MASYKPSDFFVGLVDLLAILLPGVIITLWAWPLGGLIFGPVLHESRIEQANAIVFLTAALFLGHLAYGLGALIEEVWKTTRNTLRRRKLIGPYTPGYHARTAGALLVSRGHKFDYDVPSKRYCTLLLMEKNERIAASIERVFALTHFSAVSRRSS